MASLVAEGLAVDNPSGSRENLHVDARNQSALQVARMSQDIANIIGSLPEPQPVASNEPPARISPRILICADV